MAVQAGVFSPSQEPNLTFTAGAGAASTVQTLGQHRVIWISSDTKVQIKFGTIVGMSNAAAGDFMLPANVPMQFETGKTGFLSVFNTTGGAANIYVMFLTKG